MYALSSQCWWNIQYAQGRDTKSEQPKQPKYKLCTTKTNEHMDLRPQKVQDPQSELTLIQQKCTLNIPPNYSSYSPSIDPPPKEIGGINQNTSIFPRLIMKTNYKDDHIIFLSIETVWTELWMQRLIFFQDYSLEEIWRNRTAATQCDLDTALCKQCNLDTTLLCNLDNLM